MKEIKVMESLLGAALAFSLLHFLPGTPLRAGLIRLLGNENRYLGIYALSAASLLIWLIWSFNSAPSGPGLWTVPLWWRWLEPLILLAAFVLIVGGSIHPNPSTPYAQGILDDPNPVRGVLAITRHPVMWGVTLWAASHLISQPNLRGLLFFGTFILVAQFGSWLQQRRKTAQLGDKWRRFEAATSFIPFVAIASGRARLSVSGVGLKVFVTALLIWLAALYFHQLVIGVPATPQLA
jgi:uncharacterized membrane protein